LAAAKTTFELRERTILVERCARVGALATIVSPHFEGRDRHGAQMPGHVVREQVETGEPFVPIDRDQGGLRPGRDADELAIGPPSSGEQVERAVTRRVSDLGG